MHIKIIVIVGMLALSGCGTPYVQPTAAEPAAEIIIQNEKSRDQLLEVINIDQKGCYSGLTTIPYATVENGRDIGYRVRANKKLVLHYHGNFIGNNRGPAKICDMNFYFKPNKDAKYTVVTGSMTLQNQKVSKFAKFLGNDSGDYCTVKVYEETVDGLLSDVPLKMTRPKQAGFACIEF